jgi:branched-chain amino acid transport system substrate-binding protein
MRKHVASIGIVSVFLAVFSILCVFGGQPGAWAAEPIKIGMVASLSGWGGFVGGQQRDAVMAVVEDINRKGGVLGRPLQVLVEDDQSQPTTAVVAATKLVRDRNVVALIGPSLPDSGMAMIPISEQEQVPFMLGVPCPAEPRHWSFALGPNEDSTAEATLEIALGVNHAKRVALIYETTQVGKAGDRAFTKGIPKHPGVSLVAKEVIEHTDTSMVPQMTKIKASKPDVLVVYAGGAAAANIAKNYKQLGMTTPVVTANIAQGPDFLKLAGPIAEEYGWIFPVWKMSVAEMLPADDPFRKNVYEPAKKLFQDKYGKDKPLAIYHAPLTDCVNIVTAAIKYAGSDNRAAIRDALEKVQCDGLISPYHGNADSHRGSSDARAILVDTKLKNGEFVPYK